MTDYKKMYAILCGAISDALDMVKEGNMIKVNAILQNAILTTEDMYIREDD